MSDNTCPCPKPATTTLIPVRGLSFSVSKDLFKDYPTRNEVVERIEDAKTELEEKITETKQGLEEKIQDTKDELDGKINDTRNDLEEKIRDAAEDADAKFVPQTRSVNTTAPLTGGGKLDHDLTLAIDPALLDSLATKDGVAEKVQEAKEAVEETIRETKDGLEEKIQDTKGELENTIRETADTLVPKTRVINTTGPLTGGGVLDHDLTLGVAPGAEGSVLVSRGDKAVWSRPDMCIPHDPTILTSSGTWTVLESRYYWITVVGGGGGGAGGYGSANFIVGGSGGGSGYVSTACRWYNAGDKIAYTIGAGGAGGGCNLGGLASGNGMGGGTTAFDGIAASGGYGAVGITAATSNTGTAGEGRIDGKHGFYSYNQPGQLLGGEGGDGITCNGKVKYGNGGRGGHGYNALAIYLSNGSSGSSGAVFLR